MDKKYLLKNILYKHIYSNNILLIIYFKKWLNIILLSFNIYIIYKINSYKNFVFYTNNHTNFLIREINEYIITSLKGKLFYYKSQKLLYPKITAVVIIYNSEKNIKSAIRSIQNQNMLDIEILLIDDHSTDKSLKIIEEIKKDDERIKIIKNKKNNGALYSRSLGALLSNGKYIMNLDSDDLFINKNIFNICYNEVENNNLDILEFSGFQVKKQILRLNNKLPNIAFYLKNKENNYIIKQPKLFNYLYKKKNGKIVRLMDGYIWGKCIRKNIYIKTLKKLGKSIYQQYINYGEDRIVNFVLFKIANSFKFIEEYGIIYIYNPLSIFHSYQKELIAHDELVNLMNILNYTKNSSDLNIVAYELQYRWNRIFKPGLNIENKKIITFLINLLLESKYTNSYYKYILKSLFLEIT